MNQNLVEINNNCGIVSDENGNVSLIEKKNDTYNFEEILLKENQIENLKLKLEIFKENLERNKKNIIYGEIINIVLLALEIGMAIFMSSALVLKDLILLMAATYIPFKLINILMHGTRIERHIKKKKLITKIEEIELELPTLENELANIKEKSKYKIECSTINESNEKTLANEFDYNLSLPMAMNNYYAPKVTNKVRVLKLRK